MPQDKDFKRLVRARMGKTGESYSTARAHLRPGTGDQPSRLRGRHPDTAALARLLAALGVTDPATGQPLGEAMVLGVAGGIGFAYFVFEYEDLTSLYLGGRINPYVTKADATEVALARLGVPVQLRAAELLAGKRRLLEERGGQAAAKLAAIQAELLTLAGEASDPQPLDGPRWAPCAGGSCSSRRGRRQPPPRCAPPSPAPPG